MMIDLDLKNAWDDATHDENVFCPVKRTRASGNNCLNFLALYCYGTILRAGYFSGSPDHWIRCSGGLT